MILILDNIPSNFSIGQKNNSYPSMFAMVKYNMETVLIYTPQGIWSQRMPFQVFYWSFAVQSTIKVKKNSSRISCTITNGKRFAPTSNRSTNPWIFSLAWSMKQIFKLMWPRFSQYLQNLDKFEDNDPWLFKWHIYCLPSLLPDHLFDWENFTDLY